MIINISLLSFIIASVIKGTYKVSSFLKNHQDAKKSNKHGRLMCITSLTPGLKRKATIFFFN